MSAKIEWEKLREEIRLSTQYIHHHATEDEKKQEWYRDAIILGQIELMGPGKVLEETILSAMRKGAGLL